MVPETEMRPFARPRVIPPGLMLLLAFAGTSIINYGFSLLMGHLLLPGDFGLLAFTQTVLLIVGLILNSGVPWSLAAALLREEPSRRTRLVRGAVLANLILAGIIGLGLLALFALGPLRSGLETGQIALIIAMTLPFMAVLSIARGAAQGVERFGTIAAVQSTEITVKFLVGVLLVRLGFGVTGALTGFLIGAIFAAALGIWRTMQALPITVRGPITFPPLGDIGAMFGATLGLALLLNLDMLSLKLFHTRERSVAGYYQAGIVLANAPYFLVTSAIVPVIFTQLARERLLNRTTSIVGSVLRMLLTVVIPAEMLLVVLPAVALRLFFPHVYVAGAPALRRLAVGNGLLILVTVLSASFQATGRARISARVLLTIAAVESVVLWWVVPRWQAIGASTVFVIASCTALTVLGTIYLAQTGATVRRQSLQWTVKYGITLLASIATAVQIVRIGGSTILAGLVAGAVYVTAVATLRLVDPRHAWAIGIAGRHGDAVAAEHLVKE